MVRAIGAVVAAACCVGWAWGQVPYQVADLYPGVQTSELGQSTSSAPRSFVVHDGVAYFRASDANNGSELWRSDGTAEGTWLALDFTPFVGFPSSVPWPVVVGDRMLVFCQIGPLTHVFTSDGTPGGTSPVATINGRNISPDPRTASFSAVVMGGSAYFWLVEGGGLALWRTDGTAAGTRSVFRFPQTAGEATEMTASGDGVYFVMNDGVHGRELWRSDGTAEGTRLVRDIVPGTGSPAATLLRDVAGTLFFVATAPGTGAELWRSDGTEAGTVIVKELRAGTSGAGITGAVALGGRLVFRASTSETGPELCVSDGTEAGTSVLDVVPGTAGVEPRELLAVGGRVYFWGLHEGTWAIWRSDGTTLGTAPVSGISASFTSSLVAAGEGLYFVSSQQLYRVDLATGVTVGLGTWNSPSGALLIDPIDLNGVLLFSSLSVGADHELFRSDGTREGTGLLRNIWQPRLSSGAWPVAPVGDRLLFVAGHPSPSRTDIYLTDGTAAGTVIPVEVRAGSGVSQGVRPFGDRFCVTTSIFFNPNLASGPPDEMYITDLTAAGTTLVASWPTTRQVQGFGESVEHAGRLVFRRDDRLYATDGTAAGTVPLGDAQGNLLNAQNLTPSGPWVFFQGLFPSDGLWRTDGTAAGTARVPAPPGASFGWTPGDPTDVNGVLYVSAGLEVQRDSVCRVDPAAARPVIMETWPNGDVEEVVAFNGRACFVAGASGGSDGLYFVGDEPGGATVVFEPSAGAAFDIGAACAVNDLLYFVASDGATGFELWRTDGTPEGTVPLGDLSPGPASSSPTLMTAIGDELFFVAHTMEHGAELWRSDGTPAGTRMVADLAPGAASSAVRGPFVRAGELLYFNASPGIFGSELWALRLACRVDVDGSGNVELADLFGFLASWFGEGPAADWDGDGEVAAADVFAFLADWFVGC